MSQIYASVTFGSTALVGLPAMISSGYARQGNGATVSLLAIYVAGSDTAILKTATGTLNVEAAV